MHLLPIVDATLAILIIEFSILGLLGFLVEIANRWAA